MKTFRFGYARVSTESQNLDRQLDALAQYGVDRIYQEKTGGTRRDRPQLEALLERLSPGDTVVVESLSRLGRSTRDLLALLDRFQQMEVDLVSLKEQIDTRTPSGQLLFTLMSALAQYERDLIAERTREGLSAARARGRKGGRPPVNQVALAKAIKLYRTRLYTIQEITEMTGISKRTLYRYLERESDQAPSGCQ